MLESAWLFVGRVAVVWTLVALAASAYFDDGNGRADALCSNAGVVGFVLWGVWTYGTLDIEVVDGGTTVAFSHPELTILGVAMCLVPAYIALSGTLDLFARAKSPSVEDL